MTTRKTATTKNTSKYLGIDIGNGYTKARKIKFPSRVDIGEAGTTGKKIKNAHYINFEDQDFILGKGTIFTGDDRYFSQSYKMCLLTAIALNFPTDDFIEVSICIGLPVTKYKLTSKKLKEHLDGLQECISVDGKEYTIRIKECQVLIEGALPMLNDDEDRILTIDMGAGTVNVTEFEEMAVQNYTTYPESMYEIYQAVSDHLNTNKNANYMPIEIEPILNSKTAIINQKEVDITEIRPIIQKKIAGLASYVKNAFKYKKAAKIYIMGGGGMDTYTYWKNEFPTAQLVKNGQSVNCEIFDLMAKGMVDDGK